MNTKPFVLKNSILTDRDKGEQMSECEEGDVQVIYIQSQFHGLLSSEVVKQIYLIAYGVFTVGFFGRLLFQACSLKIESRMLEQLSLIVLSNIVLLCCLIICYVVEFNGKPTYKT